MNEAVTQTEDEVRPETIETEQEEQEQETEIAEGEQQEVETETETEDDAEAERRRKKEKTQRRINQLTREKKEARAEAERLRKELEQYNKQTRPNPDDFDDYQDYIQAEVDYQVSQKTAKPEPPPSSGPDYVAIIQRGQEKYPDFDQVAKSDPNLTQDVAEMVALADNAEDIFYHLGKNPVELERISLLDPAQMAREVGRLEVTVKPPKPKTTNTPKPAQPLEGAASTDIDESKLSMEEWAKRRNAKRWKQGKI